MYKSTIRSFVLTMAVMLVFGTAAAFAQDGSPAQRIEVMRQKLETIKRSAQSFISVLEDEGSKEDEQNLDSPIVRLRSTEKEASSFQSQVNNLRGRLERSNGFEMSELEDLEEEFLMQQQAADHQTGS